MEIRTGRGQRRESFGAYILLLRAIRRHLYVSVSYDKIRVRGRYTYLAPSKTQFLEMMIVKDNILVQKLL